jgi:hypothetical protein
METVVNLDADVEELLRREVRDRNVAFDRVLNEAIRAGLLQIAPVRPARFVQKTYSLGSDRVDLTKALALADELEDGEIILEKKLAEDR